MTDEPTRIPTEMAHVLFMDLVGHSRLPMEAQARQVQGLRERVQQTPEYRRAEGEGDLICRDQGDGLALIFFRDPRAPLQCACEVALALRTRPDLPLRMGLHSGPVTRQPDIHGQDNVSGSGINLAERVMGFGDAGHILMSHSFADVISEYENWAAFLSYLGEYEVKHGTTVRLFNFHTPDVGKTGLPDRLVPQVVAEDGPEPGRVAILYKRHAAPDAGVVALLDSKLSAHGHSLFIDRHIAIGVEWAAEIKRQIQSAQAVIVLVSEASVRSEMFEFEVQTAHAALWARGGRPRLLPVRVAFTEALPQSLGAILDPLMYIAWNGPEDDVRLVADLDAALKELDAAMKKPPEPEPSAPPRHGSAGGAVPLDSAFYVVRDADDDLRAAIARRDGIVLLKGSRQIGKTSMLARGLHQARAAGVRTILTDLQTFNAEYLHSPESFYRCLTVMIADEIGLDYDPASWSEYRSPNMNFERFLRREVLERLDAPLVWGLDEVDRLFHCGYGSDVFGLFRSWHNRRTLVPADPWSRLTLVIAYATEAHLFISDLNQSPFNVGTRLFLLDFTADQVADLNRRHGSPLRNARELSGFQALTGGQPALCACGLNEMAMAGLDFAALEAGADRDEGIFGDHLRRLLISVTQDPQMTESLRGLLRDRKPPEPDRFFRLRTAGVVTGNTPREAAPRCGLYERFLSRHLL